MRRTRIVQALPDPAGTFDPGDPLGHNLDDLLVAVEAAGEFDPDFVSFPELILPAGVRGAVPAGDLARPIPGEVTDAVGTRAAAVDSYVWLPTYERDGTDVYNAVALIGPDGDVVGTYRKVAPTNAEMDERGVVPGTGLPTWETPFGRVGATICWDARFDEIGLALGAREVDLLFHPTRGMARGKLRDWATYFGYHVAYCKPDASRVYTPRGNVRGRANEHPTLPRERERDLHGGPLRFGVATVNTDVVALSQGALDDQLGAVRRGYPDAIEIDSLLEEGIVVLESVDGDLPVERVVEEFDLPRSATHEQTSRRRIRERADGSPILDPDRPWS